MKRLPRELEQQIMAQATTVGRTAGEALVGVPAPAEPKRRKFGNTKVECDGKKFDSKKEADRYLHLKALQAGGVIGDLECQVKYRIEVGGVTVCFYVADFVYKLDGEAVVEDVKGFRTRLYLLKKKLMAAVHGVTITEL